MRTYVMTDAGLTESGECLAVLARRAARNVNDEHRDRWPTSVEWPATEDCRTCGTAVAYGTLNNDLRCSACDRVNA